MDYFRWFELILEALCWGRKHEPPIEEHGFLLLDEMGIETTNGTGAAPHFKGKCMGGPIKTYALPML